MTPLLTPAQLAELSARIGANADRLIKLHQAQVTATTAKTTSEPPKKKAPNETRGRKPKRIANPFYQKIGPATGYGRYPFFTQEIMEGIARLDWHDRPIGMGGSSKPLSVRSLMVILEEVEEVTAEAIACLIGVQVRQAQRYVKAIELVMPFLIKARPPKLVFEMDLPEDRIINAAFSKRLRDTHTALLTELPPPTPDVLAKLRRDLGEDAFESGQFIYAAYSKELQEAA